MDAVTPKQLDEILRESGALDETRRARFVSEWRASNSELRAKIETTLTHDNPRRSEIPAVGDHDAIHVHSQPGAGDVRAVEVLESIALEAVASRGIAPPFTGLSSIHGSRPNKGLAGAAGWECGSGLAVQPPTSDREDALVGRQVGSYRLTARVGVGSFGSVYRAAKFEESERQFALKLIQRPMDADAVMRRFRAETDVQRALDKHDNIVAVSDAGTTDEGWTYLVMEYVDGQPIDQYCDCRRLNIPARLRIFAKVCSAVHFAHQHAVIHGGLKPNNILVTSSGVPQLLDFGVAKFVDSVGAVENARTVAEPRAALAQTAAVLFTPEYTSPEQLTGDALTTSSDIYTLGVLVYQLLVGRGPYELRTWNASDLFQAICEHIPANPSSAVLLGGVRWSSRPTPEATPSLLEPLRESSRTASAPSSFAPDQLAAARGCSPKRLNRILAGDLDAIALRSLCKEPDHRYSSAGHFGDDIVRFLEGLPVSARPDSLTYRAAKCARRHAVLVGGGLISALVLVLGMFATSTGLVLARRELNRTDHSFRKARHGIDELYTRITEEKTLNQSGLLRLRTALLSDMQRRYADFLSDYGTDPLRRAEAAEAHARVARITTLIGSTSEAVLPYRRAISLWEKLAVEQSGNPHYQTNLAHSLNELGATLTALPGGLDEAFGTLVRARDLSAALIRYEPTSVSKRQELGLILLNIAENQKRRGQQEESCKSLKALINLESQLAAEDPRALDPRISLATAYTKLGNLFIQQRGELLKAMAALSEAIELREVITKERPELADEACSLADDLGEMSIIQQQLGQPERALETLHRSLETFERLALLYPHLVTYQNGLGIACNRMSDLLRHRGENGEALKLAQKARILFENLAFEHPQKTDLQIGLAQSHNNIARMFQHSGDAVEALRSFQRAMDLYESLRNPDSRTYYTLACILAQCLPLISAQDSTNRAVKSTYELSKFSQLRRRVYCDRAIEALRRAWAGGFLTTEILQTGRDLDPLRECPDFQSLVRDMESKSELQKQP
jgi:serine/threonine protein kinase/tetratricopeptide (TPR) repeat protein